MQEKYIIVPRSKNLEEYTDKCNSFLLPLEKYSVGYDAKFNIEEINTLSNNYNIYVLINKFLHKNIDEFAKIYNLFNKNIIFLVEDIGLTEIIDKERLVLYENHIESNFVSINYLNKLGITSIVLNNDLTISEINEIRDKTNSKLYYFLISRNMLLYSRRTLVNNYNKYYNLKDKDKYVITDKLSNIQLEIKDEEENSTIRTRKLYAANKYIKDLERLDYLIIDTNSMSNLELKVTLEYYNSPELINILDTDYYFLENEIEYKVGDSK